MKDKDYLSTLKSALLKSEPTVIKTELFGATVFIRRLTGDYLISYEEKMAETAKAGAAREASEQVIQIVIDALVQPDGTAIPDEFKPTAAELLKAHENPELLAAVEKVKQHAIGKLEEAEKLSDSPWLELIFWLADRWGEPDPSKIAALPANTLYHWRAYFLKQGTFRRPGDENTPPTETTPAPSRVDDECAAVMRALM